VSDLALADHALAVDMGELDRVLDGDDVVVPAAIHVVDHGSEGGGLAGAGDPGDEHHPAPLHGEALEHLGQVQLLEGRDLARDVPHHAADFPLSEEQVDAKAAHPLDLIAEVLLRPLHQVVVAILTQQAHRGAPHELARDGGEAVLDLEMAVDAQHRMSVGLEVEVRRL
jgi:hypothetical protein